MPSTSLAYAPLTDSNTIGSPPTDENARTGDDTPPGMTVRASAMMRCDSVVTCACRPVAPRVAGRPAGVKAEAVATPAHAMML